MHKSKEGSMQKPSLESQEGFSEIGTSISNPCMDTLPRLPYLCRVN